MVNETVREDVMDVILLIDAREVSAVGAEKIHLWKCHVELLQLMQNNFLMKGTM